MPKLSDMVHSGMGPSRISRRIPRMLMIVSPLTKASFGAAGGAKEADLGDVAIGLPKDISHPRHQAPRICDLPSIRKVANPQVTQVYPSCVLKQREFLVPACHQILVRVSAWQDALAAAAKVKPTLA